ncbi:MAG: PAS domain S-box protein [Proteobacteria bacterium]|nr:PAS domain S-box protein [Pseudomonadota bacterium]
MARRIYFASVHDLSEQLRQEEHLRARALDLGNVFVSMAEGLVLQAKDGRIIEANPAAERILGLSRDELLGKTSIDPDWRCIREDGSPFPGEEHPGMVTLRTGRPISGALMGVYDRSASLRWIRINTQPVLGGSETIAVLATFTDVTAKRRVSEELRVARSDLRGIIDAVPVGISSWDTQPVCRFANADFAARVGIPAEQLPGMPMDRAIGLERYQADLAHIRAALAGETCMKGYSEVRPDGSVSTPKCISYPLSPTARCRDSPRLQWIPPSFPMPRTAAGELAIRMDAVREEERRSLSLELHEGLAQDLFAIKLGLESLKAHAKGRAGVTEACADLGAALDKCLERTRQYANELRPTALKHLNAADAIRSCIRNFAENSR